MDLRIEKTLDYIECHLGELLDLANLADVAGMSPSNFHKVFKKQTSYTPFQFVEKLRVTKAHNLLMEGDLLVSDLSDMLGYKDYETFSRVFKKHYLLSPDDFKAIANHIKAQIHANGAGDFIIATVDSETFSSGNPAQQLLQLAQEKNVAIKELEEAKIFTISQEDDVVHSEIRIKNKFNVRDNSKVWQTILQDISNES